MGNVCERLRIRIEDIGFNGLNEYQKLLLSNLKMISKSDELMMHYGIINIVNELKIIESAI